MFLDATSSRLVHWMHLLVAPFSLDGIQFVPMNFYGVHPFVLTCTFFSANFFGLAYILHYLWKRILLDFYWNYFLYSWELLRVPSGVDVCSCWELLRVPSDVNVCSCWELVRVPSDVDYWTFVAAESCWGFPVWCPEGLVRDCLWEGKLPFTMCWVD